MKLALLLIGALASGPVLLQPQPNAMLDNGCVDRSDPTEWDFDWSDIPGAAEYQLFVMGRVAKYPVIDRLDLHGSEYRHVSPHSYIVERHATGWRWKVRAHMKDGTWTPWSEERSFDVEPVNTDCRP